MHPHVADGAARCQGDSAGNQPGIDEEVSGDGGNERLRQSQEHHRLEFAAEPLIDESSRDHRQRLGADAERRSIPRIARADVDRALHPDTHERDDERLLRAKEQERHQVRGVPDRQRRTAGERDRKVDLPQRRQTGDNEQECKEGWIRNARWEPGNECGRPSGDN